MKTIWKFILTAILVPTTLLFPAPAHAVCPVCTIAVGAGLGLSRWLGIDDTITAIWIGGLILSMSFWFIDWLNKRYSKQIEKAFKPAVKTLNKFSVNQLFSLTIIVFMYALTLIPLKYTGIIGHPFNTIAGIDKILFGTTVGSAGFLFAKWLDNQVRKRKGKQLFVYQKVVFPLATLIIISLVLYYYGGYLYRL